MSVNERGAARIRAALGAGELVVQGDPHAGPLYQAVGGVRDGQRESASIPGRFLPIFRITLPARRQPTGQGKRRGW